MPERWEQHSFLDEQGRIPLETSQEAPEEAEVRRRISEHVDLEVLRNPRLEVRAALRYAAEQLPEEVQAMMEVLEILLKPAPQEQIKSPTDLARYFQLKIGFRQQEELWVVSVNTKNCVQGINLIYQGSVNASLVRIAELFRWPLFYNSPAMFWLHNHPSGNVEPSDEDRFLNKQIVEAGKLLDCEVLDAMIIAQGQYLSFRDKRWF
jgi:DNA repair protein RadC